MGKPTAFVAERINWSWLTGAGVVLVVFFSLLETPIWRLGLQFTARNNTQIAEASAWCQGRLDLPQRKHDTALYEGRVYSHFPPLFTIIALPFVRVYHAVPHWVVGLLIVLPIPLLFYGLFLRTGVCYWQAVVLTLGMVGGTSLWPVLDRALKGAGPYFVNHALATIALSVFLLELLGRRRVWVAGSALIVATLARQLTAFYLIPLAWLAFRCKDSKTTKQEGSKNRKRNVVGVALVAITIVAIPAILNSLKFGSPLHTGYMNIYAGRDDHFARDAHQYGLFSAHFVPRNLYSMNLGFPRLHKITMAGKEEWHFRPNMMGTGIWWTTPLLIWLLVDLRRLLKVPMSRQLLLAAGAIFFTLMFFHATGADQRGYNRFSLDFMPALLIVIAPSCFRGWRTWLSAAMIVWSIVYFRYLI